MEASDSSFKLQDRTAILTGPVSTYNQSIALRLTQLGVNIALIDRNIEKISRFATQLMDAREVHEKFGRAVAIQADLSKPHHVQDAVSRAAEAFGGLDIFIDGLFATEVSKFREPQALDELERMIDVNLRSPMLMTHAVLRFLEGRKRGRIIYLLPDLARMGLTQNALLAVTRTGIMNFAKTLSREVAENNVTVNCLALGLSEEFLLVQHKEQVNVPTALAKLNESFPGAQVIEPERIANTIAFLVSPMGVGITGQTIAVSQGMSLF